MARRSGRRRHRLAAPAGDWAEPGARSRPSWPPCPSPSRRSPRCCRCRACRPGWTVGKSGDKHLETFNADNLYEKIDGRAESFIQYGVKGMAYAFYHPTGDPSNELQLYIFEMADPLKALGKYGSEKPEEFQAVAVGDRGLHVGRQHAVLRGQVLHADRLDLRTTPSSPPSRWTWPSGSRRSRSPAAPGAGARRSRSAAHDRGRSRHRRRPARRGRPTAGPAAETQAGRRR